VVEGKARVGLTAGASAPDILVQQVIDRCASWAPSPCARMDGLTETIKFPLPKG
jgi:4-hydroxy-3-methylbut-2-en-1-yl diphosphate reductase